MHETRNVIGHFVRALRLTLDSKLQFTNSFPICFHNVTLFQAALLHWASLFWIICSLGNSWIPASPLASLEPVVFANPVPLSVYNPFSIVLFENSA